MSRVRKSWRSLGQGIAWLLIAPIRFYQLAISPMTPATCKFHPTCSGYAVVALKRHGPVKGTILAAYRVARCHPWQPGGLDAVPAPGKWRSDITADGRTVIPLADLRSNPQTSSAKPTRLAA